MEDGVTPPEQEEIDEKIGEIQQKALDTLADAQDPGFGGSFEMVPPDQRRCFLPKDEPAVKPPGPCATGSWVAQHFRTAGTPLGHGFAPVVETDCDRYEGAARESCEEASADLPACSPSDASGCLGRPPQAVANHDGYYSFVPREGLRFIVLDTVTDECGSEFCSEGSVDDPQFRWLEQEIDDARAAGQYVLVFSHHTLRTTRQPFTAPDVPENPIHYGQRVDRKDGQPQNPAGGKTLEELYCEYENVLAHVAGHEHQNFVLRHDCSQAPTEEPPGPVSVEFHEVSTAAHIDWPQQARMIELVEVGEELQLVLTMLDHSGPPNPGAPKPGELTRGEAGEQVLRLASIARELAYNDYQGSRGATGEREDRNVIVPLERPWPYPENGSG